MNSVEATPLQSSMLWRLWPRVGKAPQTLSYMLVLTLVTVLALHFYGFGGVSVRSASYRLHTPTSTLGEARRDVLNRLLSATGSISDTSGVAASHSPYRVDTSKILLGTFAYLVMGDCRLPEQWLTMSRVKAVQVFFLTYKCVCPTQPTESLHLHHFPKSSWASGRNEVLRIAMEREKQQAWHFEYLIFSDDDVELIVRHNITAYRQNTSLQGHARFRELLLRDRPAKAGVEFPAFRSYIPAFTLPCATSCCYDNNLDAFHRTVVEFLLPYTQAFDKHNWWMASETMSYRSAALFSPYCNNYREIVHDGFTNVHRGYPQGSKFQEKALGAYLWCLSQVEAERSAWQDVTEYGFRRPEIPGQMTCTNSSKPVDYRTRISTSGKRIALCTELTRHNAYPTALSLLAR